MSEMPGMRPRIGLDARTHALLARISPFVGVRMVFDVDDARGWIGADALCAPDLEPMANGIVADLITAGFGANRRAIAASYLLRHGWAAGPIIAAYLLEEKVLNVKDFALFFSRSTLLERVWIRHAECGPPGTTTDGRAATLESLLAFSRPVLESFQAWSGYSRHGLLSMLASSWMAQFANVGTLLGDRDRALRTGRRLLSSRREVARAMPETYVIASGERSEVCQILKACCLQHKGHHRRFCPTCPVIEDRERMLLNREWVCRER